MVYFVMLTVSITRSDASSNSCRLFFVLVFALIKHEAGIACWLERQTRDRKVASSNPGRSGGRIFFSRVNFVY